MKAIEIKTKSKGREPQYKQNLQNVTTFLRHSEDRIEVKNGETVNIDIYQNGNLIFSGDKYELFEKLTDNTETEEDLSSFMYGVDNNQ